MNLKDLKNTHELQTFLDGAQAVAFSVPGNKSDRYAFIQPALKQFHYRVLKKREKGIVQHRRLYKPPGFKQKYSAADITLLAEMDERYDTLTVGPSLKNSVKELAPYLAKQIMRILLKYPFLISITYVHTRVILINVEPLKKPNPATCPLVRDVNVNQR